MNKRRKLMLWGRYGGAFDPSQLPGLALWLKADAITGKNDGDAISSWSDVSGNNRNAAQATGTKQPLYKTAIIGALPVVRFDNTDDCLATGAIDFTGTAGITLFVVTANITSATDRIILETSANYNSNNGAIILYRTTSNTVYAGLRGASLSDFTSTDTVTSAATVISAVYDRSLATNEVTNWLNGATAGTRTNNNNQAGNHGNFAAFIGSRNNGAGLPLGGDIAELICYGSALSTNERQSVERYLGSKYGITVA